MQNRKPSESCGLGVRVGLCVLLAGAAVFCRLHNPVGAETIARLLVGQENGPAQQAFATLTEALRAGESLPDAVSVFYLELREGLRD